MLLIAAIGVGQLSAATQSTPITTIIPIGNASLNDVVEAVPQILSPQGKMKLIDQGRAIQVTDTPETVEAVRSIVAELGRPQPVGPNVRVSVNFQGGQTTSSRGVDVRGGYGQVNVPRRQGDRIIVEPIERGGVSVGLNSRSGSTSTNANQFIVVSSGKWASIEVGQDVPYPTYFYDYGVGLGVVPGGVQWQRVGTRLAVRPTVLPGGVINVEVAPEISAWTGAGPWQSFRYESLATTVTVANGAAVTLGGFSEADRTFNQHFFGFNESSRSGGGSFTVSASILPSAGTPTPRR